MSWYVNPNTNIYILAGVPLDPTYDHTIFFSSSSAQSSFFASKAIYTLTTQSYQRVQRGVIRVNVNAENLYNANYVMFQNAAFGNKWFYAFVKSVEYINNAVSEIAFELDVMQTWFFDYNLDRCFVEREHSATDVLFGNIAQENIDIGDEYTCNAYDEIDFTGMSVCALINKNTESGGQQAGRTIQGIYTPLSVVAGIPANNPSAVDAILNQYLEDEIVAVYQYPSVFGDASTSSAYSATKSITPWTSGALNGYTPRNKKLYCYPFNFLLMSNGAGQTAVYRWEDFSGNPTFKVRGVFVSIPSAVCYPMHYRGLTDNIEDGVVLSSFPQCAWSGDTFKAWWAQNKSGVATSALSTAVGDIGKGVAAATFTGNPLAGIATAAGSLLLDVNNVLGKISDIKTTPNQTHGHSQSDSLMASIGHQQFSFFSMSIKAQYAAIIDDYFDRFGYATKRNKVPNRNVRPHWTYTKTLGCTITGSIPAEDASKICEIYNAGITFWNNGNNVGNYSLDNRV